MRQTFHTSVSTCVSRLSIQSDFSRQNLVFFCSKSLSVKRCGSEEQGPILMREFQNKVVQY